MTPLVALQIVLDHVDYTDGACAVTEPVGAALPRNILAMAHAAIAEAQRAEAGEALRIGEARPQRK